jgi:hypothetical protein
MEHNNEDMQKAGRAPRTWESHLHISHFLLSGGGQTYAQL